MGHHINLLQFLYQFMPKLDRVKNMERKPTWGSKYKMTQFEDFDPYIYNNFVSICFKCWTYLRAINRCYAEYSLLKTIIIHTHRYFSVSYPSDNIKFTPLIYTSFFSLCPFKCILEVIPNLTKWFEIELPDCNDFMSLGWPFRPTGPSLTQLWRKDINKPKNLAIHWYQFRTLTLNFGEKHSTFRNKLNCRERSREHETKSKVPIYEYFFNKHIEYFNFGNI